ncbi:cob(I)yrinic acid a,c-diamide adenosyltransferase|uniref:Corrinoid adenosyltransferase n=1 Tax=Dendrosporobacter quercicolus TaxID=146817 RepID=A0A1G9Q8U3_9FIRM|nr:cob(I)yrinic acid a,c-diamide adenosyltransferase [Dendrosporobacter quercicolus]NSL48154.1 cob(I)yrinic acid a,c-diamide adenosyltransferase [Dendrosporobacter quercicolus DSM 1736]SDM07379.1 ATP:cob(I)alamin adenosyltransferase [Dendrosporobacter quercicolus]
MKVYTKTGDGGQTSLLSKQRVDKDHDRVNAYGTVDEASAAMGLARALCNKDWAVEMIQNIQAELILLNADLATDAITADSELRIKAGHVTRLENMIDSLELKRIPQPYFITPGDTVVSAALDLARTIVRRAERLVVTLKRTQSVSPQVPLYLNRLSDLLYVLARCVEQEELIQTVAARVNRILAEKPAGRGVEAADVMAQAEKIVAAARQGAGSSVSILDTARKVMAAAEQKAREIGVPMVIAVVDAGGNLVAQNRMDGALLGSISLALDKAYTAAALNMSTDTAASLAVPGQPLYGLNTAGTGRFVVFGGGFPLLSKGELIGGIGVSGGTVDEDMIVARAGLAAWQ